ncbi:uncharacterized protein LOC144708394 isoform X2 [Wolffia australiana]
MHSNYNGGNKMKIKEKSRLKEMLEEKIGDGEVGMPTEAHSAARKNKKRKSRSQTASKTDEGTSSVGSGKLSVNIQRKRPMEFETEDGGTPNSSCKEETKVSLRLPEGKTRKKKNSEVCMDGDSFQSGASSQVLMNIDEESKREKKKTKNKNEMINDLRNEEFKKNKTFSKNASNSGEVTSFTVDDNNSNTKCKEGADEESGGKLKKKKLKQKATKNTNATTSSSSSDGVFLVTKVTENASDNQKNQHNSSVRTDEKKLGKKRKIRHGTGEVPEKKKILEPMKHSVEGEMSRQNDQEKTPSKLSKTRKRVSFSGQDEVFPSTSKEKQVGQGNGENIVHGKRYSQEEDELIREAVFHYIKMVLNCKAHPEVRGCWGEIGADLPWRTVVSIYRRAQILLRRSETRKWEAEELDVIRRYYREHGAKWKEMAEILGKHRLHVKDAWRRRVKMPNPNKGKWSQEEYQSLFNLVNADLQIKAFEERKTKHGLLRENIAWSAISEKMSTRLEMSCCTKWYKQLTSPMVVKGIWADTDDYLLIDGLLKLDACCMEDVDWDSLVEDRPGEVCLKRWREMTKHIGGAREKSFMEQVEILASRYCPSMMEFREGTDVRY